MNHLDLIKLPALMERARGEPEMIVGLLDGPVVTNHPGLESEHSREIPGSIRGCVVNARIKLVEFCLLHTA
jgi:hypothetical protein